MNVVFPRVLTLLRKESGISQKKAAADLGVSQALLSHYEKGIRECGLDFLVRVADYYGVSCDYLLGRTPDRSGTIITAEEVSETDPQEKENQSCGGMMLLLQKKLVLNSVYVLFELLKRCNSKAVTQEVSTYLSLAIYRMFRLLYSANPQNPAALFSEPLYLFQADVTAEMERACARLGELTRGHAVGEQAGLKAENAPLLITEVLQKEYPLFASSLTNLLHNAELKLR